MLKSAKIYNYIRYPAIFKAQQSPGRSNTARSFPLGVLQASTASNKTTAPPRLVETGPSVYRWRTATSARVHPALRGRIARTTSTNATETRADTAPARTFTDRTSKSNDIVNALPLSSLLYISSFNVNCALTRRFPIKRRGRPLNFDFVVSLFLSFPFLLHRSLSRTSSWYDTTLNINFYHQFPDPTESRYRKDRFWSLKFCCKVLLLSLLLMFIYFPRTNFLPPTKWSSDNRGISRNGRYHDFETKDRVESRRALFDTFIRTFKNTQSFSFLHVARKDWETSISGNMIGCTRRGDERAPRWCVVRLCRNYRLSTDAGTWSE